MKSTDAAGRVELANQIKRGGCGDFGRYAKWGNSGRFACVANSA
jgi:hypothetical protein